MFKHVLFYFTIFFSIHAVSQNSIKKELDSVNSIKKAKLFLKKKSSRQNRLILFNEEKHKTTLAKELFKLNVGGSKTIKNDYQETIYKVVNKNQTPFYRVSYILLNSTKLDLPDLNLLRSTIIEKHKNGAPFSFLAKQHSMDKNATHGGDSGWIKKGKMHADFENEIINSKHAISDIFTIDIPSKHAYYVVLKTFEPKNISEINVLKIVEPLN